MKNTNPAQTKIPLPEFKKTWETKGIFSEHYINTRLKDSKLWPQEEEVKSLYEFCSNLWNKHHIALGKGNEEVTKQEFLEPMLEKLGFAYSRESGLPGGGTPDYLLFADETIKNSVLAEDRTAQYRVAISLLEAKKVHHPLGTASKEETPGRFPHQQVRDYLQDAADISGKPYFRWAILTNGNLWRLYCRDARRRDYFEFNLERTFEKRYLKDFAIFVALFRRSAFIKDSEERCPLDYLRDEALQHQSILENDLRKRIFNILTQLANGFYRRTENKITEKDLSKLYENCLIFLYRLLFILYAEGRELLPVKSYGTGANVFYRNRYSLQRLFPRLKNGLNFPYDEVTDLYEEILKLFHLINKGNERFKISQYNGGLFDPKKHPLLEDWRIGEKTLGNVLRRLVSANIPKGVGEQESFDFGETVDYADLEVRQLGSIYEGLLENHLELRDNRLKLIGDKAERKATGTYYTPDYIVQYIVENTLNPLCEEIEKSPEVQNAREKKIEDNSFAEAILKLNILDPAMGSGHFLVRAVESLADEIVYHPTTILQIKKGSGGLSHEQAEISYWRRRVVESCIYGVDLNPLAVELAKLSLWLTCIATDKPLSFLDHHLRPGNSLIGAKLKELGTLPRKKKTKQIPFSFGPDLPKTVSSAIQALKTIEETESNEVSVIKDKEDYWQQARKKLEPYRDVADLWTSTFFGTKIDESTYQDLAKLIAQNPKPRTKEAMKLKKKLEPYLDFYETAKDKKFFHWELEFPEVFFNEDGTPKENPGFDAIIGNPPYVKEYVSRKTFDGLRSSPYYQGKMDIWYLFACKGIDLSKRESGILTFIAQNNWVTSYGASKMRNKVIKDSQILSLIDFGNYKIFETSDIQTMIMIFKVNSQFDNYTFDFRRLTGKDINFEDVLDLLNRNQNSKAEYLTPIIQRNELIDKNLTFSDSTFEAILNKILEQGNFKLDKKREVAQGIVFPQDFVNKASQDKLGNKFKIGDGIFVLSDNEKNKIPFTKKELELIKPSYTTKELFKWYGNPKNKEWVIYTGSSFKNPKNLKPYPNIKKHLDQFKKVITSDNKPYGLHRSRDEYFFKGEKIISVRKCLEPTFTYTDFDCYVSATFYVIKTERINLKYLTALLNSKLIAFWLRHKGKMQGNNYQIDKEPLLAIPIKKISSDKQKPIINLVDKILAITNEEKQSKVKEYEQQIDQMVYKLYDLTDEEIALVEENC